MKIDLMLLAAGVLVFALVVSHFDRQQDAAVRAVDVVVSGPLPPEHTRCLKNGNKLVLDYKRGQVSCEAGDVR